MAGEENFCSTLAETVCVLSLCIQALGCRKTAGKLCERYEAQAIRSHYILNMRVYTIYRHSRARKLLSTSTNQIFFLHPYNIICSSGAGDRFSDNNSRAATTKWTIRVYKYQRELFRLTFSHSKRAQSYGRIKMSRSAAKRQRRTKTFALPRARCVFTCAQYMYIGVQYIHAAMRRCSLVFRSQRANLIVDSPI